MNIIHWAGEHCSLNWWTLKPVKRVKFSRRYRVSLCISESIPFYSLLPPDLYTSDQVLDCLQISANASLRSLLGHSSCLAMKPANHAKRPRSDHQQAHRSFQGGMWWVGHPHHCPTRFWFWGLTAHPTFPGGNCDGCNGTVPVLFWWIKQERRDAFETDSHWKKRSFLKATSSWSGSWS